MADQDCSQQAKSIINNTSQKENSSPNKSHSSSTIKNEDRNFNNPLDAFYNDIQQHTTNKVKSRRRNVNNLVIKSKFNKSWYSVDDLKVNYSSLNNRNAETIIQKDSVEQSEYTTSHSNSKHGQSPDSETNRKSQISNIQQSPTANTKSISDIVQLDFIKDNVTNIKYMVDSGAQVSVIPRAYAKTEELRQESTPLYATNNTLIHKYGIIRRILTFDNQEYMAEFNVADVAYPIIGLDFMKFHQIQYTPYLRTFHSLNTKKTHLLINNIQCKPQDLEQLLDKHQNLFKEDASKLIDRKSSIEHHIQLDTNRPISQKQYYLAPELESEVKSYLHDLEKKGIVRRSSSPYASPITIVKKPDGKLRICGDYRQLNKHTIADRYPLPHIQSFSNNLYKSTIFSKLDLTSAFHQIKMYEQDIPKTAITTAAGLYEFVYMPYGLKTASQTFQRQMDILLGHLPFVFTYIDDVIIHSETKEQHIKDLDTVLNILSENNMKINKQKSQFFKTSVDYLSYNISKHGIRPNNEKLELFERIQEPKTIGQLRKFIGILNYFSRCIINYSNLIKPLTSIKSIAYSQQQRRIKLYQQVGWSRGLNRLNPVKRTKLTKQKISNELIILNKEQSEAFYKLKIEMLKAVQLKHPIPNSIKIIEVDASNKGYGAALYQLNDNNERELISLASGTYIAKQSIQDTYTCELEGAYLAVKAFSKIIEASPTTLYTDNSQLYHRYKSNSYKGSNFEMRRLATISMYVDHIEHIKGINNSLADYLSRSPETDKVKLANAKLNNIYLGYKVDLEKLSIEQLKDQEIKSRMNKRLDVLKQFEYNGRMIILLTRDDKILVPPTMINHVIAVFHNQAHLSYKFIFKQINSKFIFKGMKKKIRQFIAACKSCTQAKIIRYNTTPNTIIQKESRRFNVIHLDVVGPLIITNKYNQFCLTIIDKYTKHLSITPLPDQTGEQITRAFLENHIKLFGIPATVITDNGKPFLSNEFKKICEQYSIKHVTTTPYHPQANGLLERQHRKIKDSIKALRYTGLQWDTLIPIIQLIWNNSTMHNNTYSPNQLVFGQELVVPAQIFTKKNLIVNQEPANDEIEHLIKAINTLESSPTTNNAIPIKFFRLKNLEQSESVFIKNHARNHKLEPAYKGPYKVLERYTNYYIISIRDKPVKINIQDIKPSFEIEQDNHLPNPLLHKNSEIQEQTERVMQRRKRLQAEAMAFSSIIEQMIEKRRKEGYANREHIEIDRIKNFLNANPNFASARKDQLPESNYLLEQQTTKTDQQKIQSEQTNKSNLDRNETSKTKSAQSNSNIKPNNELKSKQRNLKSKQKNLKIPENYKYIGEDERYYLYSKPHPSPILYPNGIIIKYPKNT